jgi:site-specific DNA-methyltransferase (adenine-specific)
MSAELLNMDCMEYMKGLEDNAFELAIVDPPYGMKKGATSRIKKHGQLDTVNDSGVHDDYFQELRRVSKNQIVWGGNYFELPKTRGFIFWYKRQPVDTYADGEYAWTSFDRNAKCFDFPFFGCHGSDKNKIHPTQKPVKLYQWLLKNYAKEGDKILDTHLGSGSSAIAAHYGGFDFVGTELDKDYYKAACDRFDIETAQKTLF